MHLTQGVTLLASTTEIQLVLASQCAVGETVWSAKASVYILIKLFSLTDLYIHLIYPSMESNYISG